MRGHNHRIYTIQKGHSWVNLSLIFYAHAPIPPSSWPVNSWQRYIKLYGKMRSEDWKTSIFFNWGCSIWCVIYKIAKARYVLTFLKVLRNLSRTLCRLIVIACSIWSNDHTMNLYDTIRLNFDDWTTEHLFGVSGYFSVLFKKKTSRNICQFKAALFIRYH